MPGMVIFRTRRRRCRIDYRHCGRNARTRLRCDNPSHLGHPGCRRRCRVWIVKITACSGKPDYSVVRRSHIQLSVD